MLPYKHFTLDERKYLQELLAQGYSFQKIADFLGRNVSSVSREVNRNRSKYKPRKPSDNPYQYHAWRAQNLYIRRRRANRPCALNPDTPAWDYIVDRLEKYWSPETICGRWHLEYPEEKPIHFSTIYRYLYKKCFRGISPKTHLRRRGKRYVTRSANYNSIQPERIIPEWTPEIRNRARLGDWEGDTVYGGVGKGLLTTLVDRKSRFLCAGLLQSRNAEETKDVIVKQLQGRPVHSISLDNGSEFASFQAIEKELDTLVYFAEPHKPWQRGTNENTNDVLRFFFPKGYDFHKLTDTELQKVVSLINDRPRKRLSWRTPAEVFFEN